MIHTPNISVIFETLGLPAVAPPSAFVFMPAGWNMVAAKSQARAQNEGGHTAIHVTPATADVCQKAIESHAEKCRRGEGHFPFIDRDHKSDDAVAWVRGFYWSEPEPDWVGGVMVQVDWTLLGALYVIGGSYQRFSPTLLMLDPDHPELVTDLPVCCGGLVNLPAFKRMPPIMASARLGNHLTSPIPDTPDQIAKAAREFKAGVDSLAKLADISTAEAFRVSRRTHPENWMAFVKHTHAEAARQTGEAS